MDGASASNHCPAVSCSQQNCPQFGRLINASRASSSTPKRKRPREKCRKSGFRHDGINDRPFGAKIGDIDVKSFRADLEVADGGVACRNFGAGSGGNIDQMKRCKRGAPPLVARERDEVTEIYV